MRSLAVVGVGLIGGSFALAVRKAGFEGPIWGVSSPRSIEAALRVGAISSGITLAAAAAEADVLYLAQPIAQILDTIRTLGSLSVRPGCLITDAGSTKSQVVDSAQEYLPTVHFLGGHPMAGKEQRGVESAEADLFRGRPYVLTPTSYSTPASQDLEQQFRTWIKLIGSNVIEMTATDHDRTVAYTSHLPQLLSTALAATLFATESPEIRQVFGSGLLDMTRLALSTPDVWTSILETNKPSVRNALQAFSSLFKELQAKLDAGDLAELFHSGAAFAREIRDISGEASR